MQHFRRHRAEQQTAQNPVSARGHHDQVSAVALHLAANGHHRIVDHHHLTNRFAREHLESELSEPLLLSGFHHLWNDITGGQLLAVKGQGPGAGM